MESLPLTDGFARKNVVLVALEVVLAKVVQVSASQMQQFLGASRRGRKQVQSSSIPSNYFGSLISLIVAC